MPYMLGTIEVGGRFIFMGEAYVHGVIGGRGAEIVKMTVDSLAMGLGGMPI